MPRIVEQRLSDGLLLGIDQLMNLVCPPECVWCSLPVASCDYFCVECKKTLVSNYHRCQKCATPVPSVVPNHDCFRCREARWRFSRVITLGPYRGRLREAVILTKKRSFETLRVGIGKLIGELVLAEPALEAGEVIRPTDGLAPLIVPVPYHWTHAFSGTAHASTSLAHAIGRRTGIAVKTRIASRTRKTAKQGMLSWTERKKNVRGAFQIHNARELSGRHVLIVDDVLTSGATASELAGKLLGAGAREVTVAVIARGTGSKDRSTDADKLVAEGNKES